MLSRGRAVKSRGARGSWTQKPVRDGCWLVATVLPPWCAHSISMTAGSMNDRHVIRVQFRVRRRFVVIPLLCSISHSTICFTWSCDKLCGIECKKAQWQRPIDQTRCVITRWRNCFINGFFVLVIIVTTISLSFIFFISQVLDHNVYVCLWKFRRNYCVTIFRSSYGLSTPIENPALIFQQ